MKGDEAFFEDFVAVGVTEQPRKIKHQPKTMVLAEIEEEMEALEAIFGEEYEKLSNLSCAMTISPNSEPPFYISCVLEWTFPLEYPTVAPELQIRGIKGLNDIWNKELHSKLMKEANDNMLGAPMIFTLVDVAREWLTERNVPGLGEDSMHSKMMRAQYAKQMQVETEAAAATAAQQQGSSNQGGVSKTKSAEATARKQKESGTAVTPETFEKWMRFCVSREEGQAKLALGGKQAKLTGRQIYEQGGKAVEVVEDAEGLEDFDPRLLQEGNAEEDDDDDDASTEDEDDDDDEEDEEE